MERNEGCPVDLQPRTDRQSPTATAIDHTVSKIQLISMGIWGLHKFLATHVNGGTGQVDIALAIDEWKKSHSQCVIVVDVMGLTRQLAADTMAALCGHRYWLLATAMAGFFRRLAALGVRFVFFVDGPMQPQKLDAWQKRKAAQYGLTNAQTDALLAKRETLQQLSQGPIGQTLHRMPEFCVFVQLCEQFGQLHYSVGRECDWELAKYATDNEAIAVMAEDSDFLIFPGNWRYWSLNQLDTNSMQTIEYNRHALRQHLQLDAWQMGHFAAFCGNDFLSAIDLRNLYDSLPPGRTRFDRIATFIRSTFIESDSATTRRIIAQLATQHGFDAPKCRYSVDAYDIADRIDSPQPMEASPQLLRDAFGCQDVMRFVQPQVYATSFCDFDHRHQRLQNLRQLYLPLYRRQAGIVWQDCEHWRRLAAAGIRLVSAGMDGQQVLRTRLSHSGQWREIAVAPIRPPFCAPRLRRLLAGSRESESLMASRYRLLAWLMCGAQIAAQNDPFVARIRALPVGYVLVSLTLWYLTQMGQFTAVEADSILSAEMDVLEQRVPEDIEYPQHIEAHDLLLARLYVRFFTHMQSSMNLCGLAAALGAQERLRFDSVHFHKCRQQPEELAAVSREQFEELRMFYRHGVTMQRKV